VTPLLDVALAWHDAGATVLPAAADGTKRPAVAWADYQQQRPTRQQVTAWAANAAGIGLVCGAASGNLEMLELEGPAVAEQIHMQLRELLEETGHADLWAKLTTYAELTPGGGLHWLYRVDGPVPGNRKLARRRDDQGHLQVLAETRGEGGWTVLAPSAGGVHPTGKAWQLITGRAGQVATLTADEHATLHRLAATFDTADPQPEPAPAFAGPSPVRAAGGQLPGDHWAEQTDWADILTPAGWVLVGTRGRTRYWRRPGKNAGVSATTGHGDAGDWLYVFTSSTDFEPERTYTKFGALAVLAHAGDHQAAAAALKAAGYGKAAPEPRAMADPVDLLPAGMAAGMRSGPQPATDGALATVHQLPLPAVDLDTLERSEDGHAQALIATYGDVIRFCPDRGRWLAWDGTVWRWQTEDGGRVREYAKTVARALPETDTGAVAHKRKALSAAGTSGALRQARTDPASPSPSTDLDARPGSSTPPAASSTSAPARSPRRPHPPAHPVTACTPDPDADRTAWLRFLADTFGDDQSSSTTCSGSSATPPSAKSAPTSCPSARLRRQRQGRVPRGRHRRPRRLRHHRPRRLPHGQATAKHETEIARLAGRRMVVCSEVNDDDRFDEAKVKQLTGGDTLTARFMRADHFTFTPTHQLWLMGNHRPEVRAGGRLVLAPPPPSLQAHRPRRAARRRPAAHPRHRPRPRRLLAWIVAGAAAYHRGGLAEPDSRQGRHRRIRPRPGHRRPLPRGTLPPRRRHHVQLKAAVLRAAYEAWCTEAGEHPVTAKAFGIALRRAGIEPGRTKTSRYYTGIAVLDADDENASPDDVTRHPPRPRGYRDPGDA
jgi:putative DNA primase/helicase